MATDYRTPGVYVEEKSLLPPSVSGVATAIPAFIGITEKKTNKPVQKVTSLLEFESLFGAAKPLTVNPTDKKLKGHKFVLYDSMRLYFDNGGGTCYVASAGLFEDFLSSSPTQTDYKKALQEVAQQSDVTLLVMPDAAMFLDLDNLAAVHSEALKQCAELVGRFAILDVYQDLGQSYETPTTQIDTEVGYYRDKLNDNLCYGAAYYPYLKTSYPKDIPFKEVVIALGGAVETPDPVDVEPNEPDNPVEPVPLQPDPNVIEQSDGAAGEDPEKLPDDGNTPPDNGNTPPDNGNTPPTNTGETETATKTYEEDGPKITSSSTQDEILTRAAWIAALPDDNPKKKMWMNAIIPQIEGYADKLEALQDEASVIPPSGALAGLYVATDHRVGVWQAPANIGIAGIKDLNTHINDNQQASMNDDPTSRKSVNAIRFIKGKGILVWGSRTLDGGSNEWRFIPVRRLFSYVEQSVKLATAWAVFQPNDSHTWIKIKCQISNFLSDLWRSGALAGASPEDSYFVEVGENITMTSDDINRGYLRVRIGLAAVRPAEFIILEFSHKVQE